MSFIYLKFTSKNILNIFLAIFIFSTIINHKSQVYGADISVGKAIITNECGTLGSNNPLRLLDCSIFKMSNGMCCMLTVTTTEIVEQDGVQSILESYKTACIILEEYSADVIRKMTNRYKKFVGDVLIECSQRYLKQLYIYLSFAILFFLI